MINVPVHQQNKEVLQRQQFWSLETSVSSYGYLHLSPLILNTLKQKTYQCFFSKMNFCAVSSFCLSPSGFIHNMSCTHNTENPLPVVWMKSLIYWQGHPKCLYSMKHDSAFMTSVTFIHILQMSFKLAVVQTSLRFTPVPLLLFTHSDSSGLRRSNRPQNEPDISYTNRLLELAWYLTHTKLWSEPYNIFRCGKMGPPFKPY